MSTGNRLNGYIRIALLGAAFLPLSGCNGIFDFYDDPARTGGYGFVSACTPDTPGTIYINTSSYTAWKYIDLGMMAVDSTDISPDGTEAPEPPADFDFAVHRYDVKTNGGSVLETEYSSFGDLLASGALPEGDYVRDEWTTDRIAIDMSGMMDGVIVYAESDYNPEFSKWLNVDTSVMPPIYTMSGRIYILKLADGTCAAVKLANYINETGVKGYMTIEYIYPLEF